MTGDPVSGYLVYRGPYHRAIRVTALTVVTLIIATSRPRPALHGHGLVILVSLIVAVAAQIAAVVAPNRLVRLRTAIGAISAGVLAGYDSGTSAALLVFAGLDAGAMLEFGPGVTVTALAVVCEALGVVASGHNAVNLSTGLAAAAGFLAATTFKQYTLRIEDAELRLADAERAREEHARAVSLAERAMVAREIHDILAHSLGALVLQLDAVDAVLSGEPPEVDRARPLVGRARLLAAEGLAEARRAVGSLRQDPLPLVESLRQLIESTGTGSLEITGTTRPLPSDVSLAVRRTAQESLTNAAKHAPGSSPRVRLHFDAEAVVLTVTDKGRARGAIPTALAETGGGFGIEGLGERAKLIGASLVAGPTDLGWEVRLRVPNEPSINGSGTT